jgi:acyl-CoA reductase-like NAD-dependent aldehyde dehydrogenase
MTLELGGNDAAIVLRDADPAKIAEKLFWGAFQNSGQVCSAVKRVYVHEDLYSDLSTRLAEIAKNVKVGDGLDPASQLGPINNKMQFDRVCELVDDARKHGAKFLSGGKPVGGPGHFFEPTIVGEVSDGTRIVDEEQFGPALPVIRYRDVDDAIERANATHFGLGGSVWGSDLAKASEVASRLESGTSWVNTHLALQPNTPFGGAKWSGIGVENGPWGLMGFTEIQTFHVSKV